MRRRGALLILGVLGSSACRDRHPAPTASASPSASTPPPRVVCAPVQGPTKIVEHPPDGAKVASFDGRTALHLESHEDENHVPTYHAELHVHGEPARTLQLPKGGRDLALGAYAFRGPNVVGFGADRHFFAGGDTAYIVWATLSPRVAVARRVESSFVDGALVYFTDMACRMHMLDLQTGIERTGASIGSAAACPPFHVWGKAIAIGKSTYSGSGGSGFITGIDFGERVVDAHTGKLLPKPYCPHPVGSGSCVTFDDDLRVTFDDDPVGPESSSSETNAFEVRGPHHEIVRGRVTVPHSALSYDHAVLWRDTRSPTLAFVATHVDGSAGAQLITVADERIETKALSAEETIDQRRITALRSFVPYRTPAEHVEKLLRERESALAAASGDHVRFMEYGAAASAHVPCSSPPR